MNVDGTGVDARHIYWTNDSGTIGRANLDGTGVDQNFIRGGSQLSAIAVEAPYLYWANASGIGRASIDGTGVDPKFIPDDLVAVGVAADSEHPFWTNLGPGSLAGSIGRANLDGTGVNQRFISGASRPLGLAVSFTQPVKVPTAVISPSKLDFGSQPVSTLSAPMPLTVSNAGTALLKISSVRVSSGAVDDFLISRDTCSNSTLSIDGTCIIDVRFGPTASGPRSATLSLVSNDPSSPLQVPLTGVGTGKSAARGRPGTVNAGTGTAPTSTGGRVN